MLNGRRFLVETAAQSCLERRDNPLTSVPAGFPDEAADENAVLEQGLSVSVAKWRNPLNPADLLQQAAGLR